MLFGPIKHPVPSLCDTCKFAYRIQGGLISIGGTSFTQRYCATRRDVNIHTDGKSECVKYEKKITYEDVEMPPEFKSFFEEFGGCIKRDSEGSYTVWPSGCGLATEVVPTCECGAFYVSSQESIGNLKLAAAACYHVAKLMKARRHAAGCL